MGLLILPNDKDQQELEAILQDVEGLKLKASSVDPLISRPAKKALAHQARKIGEIVIRHNYLVTEEKTA